MFFGVGFLVGTSLAATVSEEASFVAVVGFEVAFELIPLYSYYSLPCLHHQTRPTEML